MADENVRASDPRNLTVIEGASFWLRNKGSTDPADWREVGSVMDVEFDPQDTRIEHLSNRRGARVKDREIITERKLGVNFKLEEINLHNLQYMFGDAEDAEAGAEDFRESFIKLNPGQSGTVDLGRTDIKNVIVRSPALDGAETTYTETTDYTVDLSTGIMTIAAGALADEDAVPEFHVYFEYERQVQNFQLFPGQEIEVEAEFQVTGTPGQKYVIPAGILKIAGSITFGNGGEFQSVPMRLEALGSASSGSLGRGALANEGELDS